MSEGRLRQSVGSSWRRDSCRGRGGSLDLITVFNNVMGGYKEVGVRCFSGAYNKRTKSYMDGIGTRIHCKDNSNQIYGRKISP